MSDLLGLGIIILTGWMAVSFYVRKWKRDNPGQPVFEWVETPAKTKRGERLFDKYSGLKGSTSQSEFPEDKWLSPGGCTTEYYDYYRRRDEDSRAS